MSPVWRHLAMAVAMTAACAVIVLLGGCGGGDCPETEPGCTQEPQRDAAKPQPPCTDPRRCI